MDDTESSEHLFAKIGLAKSKTRYGRLMLNTLKRPHKRL
jgi:hypothetical protein